jgi:8-oxo-dGTP diphosphatase
MHHHPDSPSRITLCVGAVVLQEEKVLFVRQTYGKLKGKWSLPWGFVDGIGPDGSPESPDEAAIRETQEEAGITARVAGLLGILLFP